MERAENTYTIPAENWGWITFQMEKLNKKASKVGTQPIIMSKIDEKWVEEKKDGKKVTSLYYTVKMIGEAPKLAGWKLIASIDHEEGGNIIRNAPSESAPEEYRHAATTCDHCNHKRRRKNTFILQSEDTGEYVQVGRSCLRDFLGHTDPKKLISMSEMIRDIEEALARDPDAEYSEGNRSQTEVITYLMHVATMIREKGWISKGKADTNAQINEENEVRYDGDTTKYRRLPEQSTSSAAISNMYPAKREYQIKPTEEDFATARNALEWCQNLEPRNDFEHNIHVVSKNFFINYKHFGLAAAIVYAYVRQQEQFQQEQEKKRQKAIELAEKLKTATHIGEVGTRYKWTKKSEGLTLKLVSTRDIAGTFGATTIHNMVDRDGNEVTWFASTESGMETGKWYKVDATVKAHKEFQGIPQTIVNRLKVVEETGE